jgi:predicted metal-dependent hydrolase
MALRKENIEGIGPVTLQKRRGTHSVRIHIHGSEVRVTLPHWFSYTQAISFTKTRTAWINEHRKAEEIISHGSYVGKKYQVVIRESTNTTIRSKITDNVISISMPAETNSNSPEAQQKIRRIIERAFKLEAEALIAPRLQDLALERDFQYRSVSFKKLKTRWGSCDNRDNIIINIFLIQMPWQLIDYVLLHELAHTQQRNHSLKFWEIVESTMPDYKKRRKALKEFQPHLIIN